MIISVYINCKKPSSSNNKAFLNSNNHGHLLIIIQYQNGVFITPSPLSYKNPPNGSQNSTLSSQSSNEDDLEQEEYIMQTSKHKLFLLVFSHKDCHKQFHL